MTWVGRDPERFAELMQLFLNGDYRVTQRSAWAVMHCATRHPELVTPWLGPMIGKMQEPDLHIAVRRNVIRILQDIEIPKKLMGRVADLCFRYLNDVHSPIAVKVFSMTVLANIAQGEPDMARELRAIIELMLPYSGAAMNARARMILKTLDETKRRRASARPSTF